MKIIRYVVMVIIFSVFGMKAELSDVKKAIFFKLYQNHEAFLVGVTNMSNDLLNTYYQFVDKDQYTKDLHEKTIQKIRQGTTYKDPALIIPLSVYDAYYNYTNMRHMFGVTLVVSEHSIRSTKTTSSSTPATTTGSLDKEVIEFKENLVDSMIVYDGFGLKTDYNAYNLIENVQQKYLYFKGNSQNISASVFKAMNEAVKNLQVKKADEAWQAEQQATAKIMSSSKPAATTGGLKLDQKVQDFIDNLEKLYITRSPFLSGISSGDYLLTIDGQKIYDDLMKKFPDSKKAIDEAILKEKERRKKEKIEELQEI